MVGDMDNTGSLNAQVIHQLTSAVRSKIAIQVCSLIFSYMQSQMLLLLIYVFNLLCLVFPIILRLSNTSL